MRNRVIVSAPPTGGTVHVLVDGRWLDPPDVSPYLNNGRTMVPLRALAEQAFGYQVAWDDATQTVRITGQDADGREVVIVLPIGSNEATVNGEPVTLDVQPQIVNDRVCVPLRFVVTAFGAGVVWDEPNRTVIITTRKAGQ